MEEHYLAPLFSPRTVVVISVDEIAPTEAGSDNMLARQFLENARFDGKLEFLTIGTALPNDATSSTIPDLAVITVPMDRQLFACEFAGRLKAKTAIVLSMNADNEHSSELRVISKRYGMHILGPNAVGLQRPHLGLNASVLGQLPQKGSLALVSQSGALTTSVLDWAGRNGVGFSAVVSLGANTILGIAEVLDYLAGDRSAQSIVVYLEGICDARRFMSALRAAAYAKPVVVLKSGRKPSGSRVALTHSGAIVGTDDVFDAALRRAGAVRVRSFVQLFTIAKCLSARYRPRGKRLAIITNGGGPGILAADWASDLGLLLALPMGAQLDALLTRLPARTTAELILDLTGEADAAHYRAAIAACAASDSVDGVLAILAPKPGLDNTGVAKEIAGLQTELGKLVITCWMGDEQVVQARTMLHQAGIPTFRTPEAAVDAFSKIASFHQNQQLLYQTPPPLTQFLKPDLEGARILIESVLAERRQVLTEMESKALLSAFHIPVTQTILARSATEAMIIANQLGYPVALKVDSPDIPHKSDVEGVALNIASATAVRDAWHEMMTTVRRLRPDATINGITVQNMSGKRHGRELYIGLSTDQPYGPAIPFGAGGRMIEIIDDRAVELPPLNQFLAQRLIDRVRSSAVLGAWRGAPPADRQSLEQILLRVSEMVCELPQLSEMDINPVTVDQAGALVVDARIVVRAVGAESENYGHLAILPYPSNYKREWPLPGGGEYIVRPVHPADACMIQDFVRSLSSESRYFRFATSVSELSDQMLARFTLIDYDREMALIALCRQRDAPEKQMSEKIIAVSRYVTNPDSKTCEFSLVVADEFAKRGVGTRMLLSIMDVARHKGLMQIVGLVLVKNASMLKLMRRLGFKIENYDEDPDFRLCVKNL